MSKLAINGGTPVREQTLPYGRQSIDELDIAAVVDVLKSDWLTTGPKVNEFEKAFADVVGARYAVAVSSGTAALHAAMFAIRIGPGDEVIVPAMTFAATANCVAHQGGTPVFADVDPDTLLIDLVDIEKKITNKTAAIIAVDYAGQTCDYEALLAMCSAYNLILISDASHALGARYYKKYRSRPHNDTVGAIADLTTFSLHPVKHITTGEGGIITTDNPVYASAMRMFRNHGIDTTHSQRTSWSYEMRELGYNYRLTDIQCALGLSQLKKLNSWIENRSVIASYYTNELQRIPEARPLIAHPWGKHAYHLYVIKLDLDKLSVNRAAVFNALRAEGIGVNVHYIPVHLHPYYRSLGNDPGLAPVAERVYQQILSLPIFPQMTYADSGSVIKALKKVIEAYKK